LTIYRYTTTLNRLIKHLKVVNRVAQIPFKSVGLTLLVEPTYY